MRLSTLPLLALMLAVVSGCGVTRSLWKAEQPQPGLATLHAQPPVVGQGDRIHLNVSGRFGDLRDDAAIVDLVLRRSGGDDRPLAACNGVALHTCGSPTQERADLWLVDFTHVDGTVSTWRVVEARSLPGRAPTPAADSLPVAHAGDRMSAQNMRLMNLAARVAVTPIAIAADVSAYAVVGAAYLTPAAVLAAAKAGSGGGCR